MDLASALKKLIYSDPFYGLFLLNINKRFSTQIETAAVARSGVNCELLINKEYWDSLDNAEQIFVLKHEIGHILFKHMFVLSDLKYHEIANIAADCEINQYIDPECKYIDKYFYPKRLELPEKLGSREYYRRILNNESKLKIVFSGGEAQADHGNQEEGGQGQIVDDHSGMYSKDKESGFGDLTDAERELISKQIDYVAKHTAEQVQKQRGTIPGCFKGYIDSLFVQKKQIFNWKQYFRRLIGTAISVNLKKTRKKESFRFPDCSAIKYKRKSKILVAVDTSGSVSDKELCDFFSEINHLCKANVAVDICECDTEIKRVYKYDGKWDKSICGRGGTTFDPPIHYFNQNRDYTMIVYFTDGYAPLPEVKVRNNQIVWVITSNGHRQNYPGYTIYIPNE